jgi:hypothetical protein
MSARATYPLGTTIIHAHQCRPRSSFLGRMTLYHGRVSGFFDGIVRVFWLFQPHIQVCQIFIGRVRQALTFSGDLLNRKRKPIPLKAAMELAKKVAYYDSDPCRATVS